MRQNILKIIKDISLTVLFHFVSSEIGSEILKFDAYRNCMRKGKSKAPFQPKITIMQFAKYTSHLEWFL